MSAADGAGRPKAGRVWLLLGLALLVYAVLGNWVALPGYRRFLEHAGPGGGGERASGLAFLWGAVRTIVWMLSFHLGALCLAWSALAVGGNRLRAFRRGFLAGALLWIALWTIPKLPGPYTAVFAGTGVVILALIVTVFAAARARIAGKGWFFDAGAGHWQIAAVFFFALATWDICGLGSVGRILDPSGEVRAANHALVVAQTSKLLVELAIAWALLAVAALSGGGARQD